MGYEVKVYVGERSKHDTMREDGHAYFSVVGMVDLCKPGYGSKICKLCGEDSANEMFPAVSAYLRNGDDREKEDCYSKKLRAVPIDLVINALEQDCKDNEYWRFPLALELLKSAQANYKRGGLEVILYGY